MKTSIFLLAIISTLTTLHGQSFQQVSRIAWRADVIRESCIGDFDGDGDGDMLVSANEPNLVWYENVQENFFNKEHVLDIAGFDLRDLIAVDVDGDNDIDIFALDYVSNAFVWFANSGDAQFTFVTSLADTLSGLQNPRLEDLDNDGDQDVLGIAVYDQKIFYIENTGSGNFGDVIILDSDAAFPRDAYPQDINGDGLLDIITSPSQNSLYWHENLGAGNFGFKQAISLSVNNVRKIGIADLDGDLDNDILSNSTVDQSLIWFENDGTGVFGEEQIIFDEAIVPDYVLFDLENDGDLDLAFNRAYERTIVVYTNNGLGIFSLSQTIINDPLEDIEQFQVLYLNADTYPDLVGGCDIYEQTLINTEGVQFDEPVYVTPQLSSAKNCSHGDLNGDGDMEIVYCSYLRNQIVYFDSLGLGEFDNFRLVSAAIPQPTDVFIADFNGDGKNDIGYKSFDNQSLGWFENDGSGNFPLTHSITSTIATIKTIYAIDIDLDTDVDIAVINDNANITWFENDGSGSFSGGQFLLGLSGLNDIAISDLDLDGDLDVCLISDEVLSIRINNGDLSYNSAPSQFLPFATSNTFVSIGDLNQDDMPDIVVSSENEGVYWLENLSDNQFSNAITVTGNPLFSGQIEIADLNQDGLNDLVSGKIAQESGYWLRNNGNDTFDYFPFTQGSALDMRVADLDNDDDFDVYYSSGTIGAVYFNSIGEGCTDPIACNYDPNASSDNGSCNYYQPGDFNCDGSIGGNDDIEDFLAVFGCVGDCGSYDLDGDGFVGTNDLMMFFALIGE